MPEALKTSFVSEFAPDTVVTTVLLVLRKEVRQKKDGAPYLALTLGDRTGHIDANMWDGVEAAQSAFATDDFVRVKAQVALYRDKPQLKIERLRRVEENEVSLADYLPVTAANIGAMWHELEGRIAAMTNQHLQALLLAVFGDPNIAERFRRAPAAKVLHHAYLGGLLEHVTSLCRLAEMASAHYDFVDRDLLLTGVLLHDLGKIAELNYERSFSYSTPGQLLGHMVQVLEILQAKAAALPGFPSELLVLVEHLVISHHGKYEFGSPKLPMFPEALLLHQLDDMDSKMQSMHTELEAQGEGEWTAYNRSLERPLLRVQRYLHPESVGGNDAAEAGGR